MKRYLIYGAVFFTVIACGALVANHGKKDATLVNVLTHSLEMNHFKPKVIDDDFSKESYQIYIDRLDHYKRFLTASDISVLNKYETKIDDEINSHTFDFFDTSLKLITQRIDDDI